MCHVKHWYWYGISGWISEGCVDANSSAKSIECPLAISPTLAVGRLKLNFPCFETQVAPRFSKLHQGRADLMRPIHLIVLMRHLMSPLVIELILFPLPFRSQAVVVHQIVHILGDPRQPMPPAHHPFRPQALLLRLSVLQLADAWIIEPQSGSGVNVKLGSQIGSQFDKAIESLEFIGRHPFLAIGKRSTDDLFILGVDCHDRVVQPFDVFL